MQALIDFDGWREWKNYADKEEAGKTEEAKAKEREQEEKQRVKMEKMAKLQEKQRLRKEEEERKKREKKQSVEATNNPAALPGVEESSPDLNVSGTNGTASES